jgi:hypothetical protein
MVVTFGDGFRQLRDRIEDDAFAESVLGSQGNQEDPERFVSARHLVK